MPIVTKRLPLYFFTLRKKRRLAHVWTVDDRLLCNRKIKMQAAEYAYDELSALLATQGICPRCDAALKSIMESRARGDAQQRSPTGNSTRR